MNLAANSESDPQDDVKNLDRSGTSIDPLLKDLIQTPVKSPFQSQSNNIRGYGYDNDLESKVKIWLNWIKNKSSLQYTKKPIAPVNTDRVMQLTDILQRNDEAVQKIETTIINSQAYTTIIQNLLDRLEKNVGLQANKAPEKIWNNNLIARYIENMLDINENDNSQHVTIQVLRLLLRSIDRNMDRLDKGDYLLRKNSDEKVVSKYDFYETNWPKIS